MLINIKAKIIFLNNQNKSFYKKLSRLNKIMVFKSITRLNCFVIIPKLYNLIINSEVIKNSSFCHMRFNLVCDLVLTLTQLFMYLFFKIYINLLFVYLIFWVYINLSFIYLIFQAFIKSIILFFKIILSLLSYHHSSFT